MLSMTILTSLCIVYLYLYLKSHICNLPELFPDSTESTCFKQYSLSLSLSCTSLSVKLVLTSSIYEYFLSNSVSSVHVLLMLLSFINLLKFFLTVYICFSLLYIIEVVLKFNNLQLYWLGD